jgi:acetylornithine deacetylase
LTTHLDTVPPFFAPTWEGDRLQARGACDAKGQIVAQWLALHRLRERGLTDLAWLGVVGEESDSVGARAAVAHVAWRQQLAGCRAIINGEPTQGKLAKGQRGVLLCRLTCHGRAAHSALPEQGRSAIWMLFDWLAALRHESAGADPELGCETWNVGLCRGGEAANSVPAFAEAQVLFRTIPGGRLPERLKALSPIGGEVSTLLDEPPMRFHVVPGFATTIVPYGSDAPTLAGLVPGAAMLQVGPGNIELAHTDAESVTLAELLAGADVLEKLGLWSLTQPEGLAAEEA